MKCYKMHQAMLDGREWWPAGVSGFQEEAVTVYRGFAVCAEHLEELLGDEKHAAKTSYNPDQFPSTNASDTVGPDALVREGRERLLASMSDSAGREIMLGNGSTA